ncbi:hypothetical protein BZJ19_16190 [Salinivibrio proteolyticus]|uniref:tetratricopeptide repeat protein n=1 Tax=Salinivibrio proteolyticus TaxID=334715 RepID=UPI0009894ED8|nr:hypothetical protein [Salinivibrio proteolyticus]OOF21583.1 hypothetical protein BZJ19_16190 [Salinivibrio proteolyticus]
MTASAADKEKLRYSHPIMVEQWISLVRRLISSLGSAFSSKGIHACMLASMLVLAPAYGQQTASVDAVSGLIQQGAYQQALQNSKTLLNAEDDAALDNSARAELLRLQGVAHLYLQQRAEAYRSYRQALALNALSRDSEADALSAVITLAYRVKQYDEVLRYARQMAEHHELLPHANRLAMQSAYALSRYDVAIDYASRLQKSGNADAFTLQTKGLSEMALSQFSAAARTFDALAQQDDVAPKWLAQAARAHAHAGSHSQARQYLARARADIALYRTLALEQLEQTQPQEALAYWQQGLSQLDRVPTRDEQLLLVQCLLQSNQLVAALNRVSEINLSAPDKQTLKLQVMLAYQLKRWQEVIDTSQVALSHGLKEDRMLWQWLSISAIKAGDYALADFALNEWQARDTSGLAERWRETLELLKAGRASLSDLSIS